MDEIWEYIEQQAMHDPSFHAAYKASQYHGREKAVLELLRFLKTQRDNLFKSAIECAQQHPRPVIAWPKQD